MRSRPPDVARRGFVTRGRSHRFAGRINSFPDLILASAFFVAPLGVLVAYSVGRQDPLTQNVRIQRTLRAYRLLFSDLYRPVQLRSLELSAACLVVCIGVGVPSAVAVSRASPRTQRSLLLAILLPSS